MSLDLGRELLDAGKVIGILSADGNLDASWFSQPDRKLGSMLSDATQRAALLDLLDQFAPPAAITGLPAGEKWHPLLGAQPRGNLYVTVRTDGPSVVLGMAGDLHASAGGAALRASLPLVSFNASAPAAIAGGPDGPLEIALRVELHWTRPAQAIALAAVSAHIQLAPLASEFNLRVTLEGLDLDGSGPRDRALDPSNLDSQATQLVVGLLRQKLHDIAAGAPGGEAAALASHLMPALGLGAPPIPPFPFADLLHGPAALQNWLNAILGAGAMPAWLGHVAGLFGSTAAVTGTGAPAQPWKVRLVALDAGASELSLVLTSEAQKLHVGFAASVAPGGASPAARVEAAAMLAGIPLAGAGSAAVLSSASVVVRAPGGASALIAPGGAVAVNSIRAGVRWDGARIVPLLELDDVHLGPTHYDQIDLTNADSVLAAASAGVRTAILAALGGSPLAQHLAALAGLAPPSGDPSWPFALDLAALVSHPAQAIAAVHRAALLSPAHNWGFLLGELAGLLDLAGGVTGAGVKTDPWRVALAEPGPLNLELVAWNAQESGVAADPQMLRLGLRLSAASAPWQAWWLAELLAVDLPASGSGNLALMAGQHAAFLLDPAPAVPPLAGITLSAGSLGITLDWDPGGPLSIQAGINNLAVTENGASTSLGSLRFPPAAPFDISNPAASLGIPAAQLETLVRLLAARAAYSWGNMEGLALSVLLGIHGNLPGLPPDWPTLRDPGAPGSLFRDPLAALRDWLARLAPGVSAAGAPFLPPTLDWLRALLAGALPQTPAAGPPLADTPLPGYGVYDDPWRVPVGASDSLPVELLAWLEPAGPPPAWAAALAARAASATSFRALLEVASLLGQFLPQARQALALTDPQNLGANLGALADYLAGSDGVVPLSSQIPTGGAWMAGTPLTSAHPDQPADPAAIAQIVAQVNTWAPAARAVLLLGPAFSDHGVWGPLLARAEAAQPGATNAAAQFDLRAPGLDPASIDLRTVTVVAGFYTADLQDDGSGNLDSLSAQIGRLVDRIRALRPGAPVILVAHSTAGVAARVYTAANSTLVRGLVTLGTPHLGAPLEALRDPQMAGALRFLERFLANLPTGPLANALAHLVQALDFYTSPGAPGTLPAPFPYPVGSFGGTTTTDTAGVPALALGGTVAGDLRAALAQALGALAASAAVSGSATPTHLAFGAGVSLPTSTGGDVAVNTSVRADAFRVALDPGAPEPPRPERSLTVLATLSRPGGWLVGAPQAFAELGAPPVDVRVRFAELGCALTPAAGSFSITPLVRLHDAAFHGPALPLTQLGDVAAEPLLGAVLQVISAPPPSPSSAAGVLLDALSALGVAVPDPHGGIGVSADALAALRVDARAYLGPRFAAALARPQGLAGFGGPAAGPWVLPIGAGPLEVYLSNGAGVRTAAGTQLGLGAASLAFDARLSLPAMTGGLDLSFALGAITLTYTQSNGRLTLAAPPWLQPFDLVPAPAPGAIAAAFNNLIPRLLLSSAVSGLLEAAVGRFYHVGPIDRLISSPSGALRGANSLGNGSALDAGRINTLLGVIGAAAGAPLGPGLALPAGLRLSASGGDPLTLRLATTAAIGGVLSFELDANIDALLHVTPAGAIALHVALPAALPGAWPGVTIAFAITPAGVTLAVTPDGAAAIQLLPSFSGLGALASAVEQRLLPAALDAVVNALGSPPPALAALVLGLAQALDLYDPAGKFSAHTAQLQALLHGDWLNGLSARARAAALDAIGKLFNDAGSPLRGALPGSLAVAGDAVTWSFGPSASLSGTLAATLGWDGAGAKFSLSAVNLKLNDAPLALTLQGGFESGHIQAAAALGFSLQSSLGIAVTPQLAFSYNGAGFAAHFYPLGDAPASALDIELLPTPGVHTLPEGPARLIEKWLTPMVADALIGAARPRLANAVWTGGPAVRQLLVSAGLLGAGDALATPLPPPLDLVTGFLQGLLPFAQIPVTGTLALSFVSETPPGGAAPQLGLRLRGHQDIPAGDLTISVRFGETSGTGPSWIADTRRGVTLYLFTATGLNFIPQLSVIGLGASFAGQGDTPLINTSLFRSGAIGGYLFFNVNLAPPLTFSGLGAGVEMDQVGIPLGQAVSGNSGGNNPVAAGLLQSDGGAGAGDPHPVNPAVDLVAVWRNNNFSFIIQNQTSALWLGVHRKFGPIYIDQVGVEVSQPTSTVALLVDGSVQVSGLTVQADDLSVVIPLRSLASPGDWTLDLRGLALGFTSSAVKVAGGLIKNPGPPVEYDGMLSVEVAGKGFTAVGAYARPSDSLGGYTSLFLFVALPLTLGGPPFFFVTGLGGGAGYNRRLLAPTDINQIPNFLLVAAIDDATFANDPMGALRRMSASIPARRGSFWFAAGVRFDTFALIHSIAVVYVALDRGLEIGLVGVSRMALPSADLAIARVELALKARFSTAEGILSVQAQLTDNSYLLDPSCQLTGGFAFFAWFPKGQFVLTLGGYHPAFQRPPEFPIVPRLGFRWNVSGDIVIKGEAYFALTNTCVMAGGRLEAAAHFRSIRAWFIAYADFLVSWDPFHYDISVGVQVGVSATFRVCFFVCGTLHLELCLGASVHILGPPLHGEVSVDVYITSITVAFGPEPAPQPDYIQDFELFRAKYLTAGDPQGKAVGVRVGAGLAPPEPPGAAPAAGAREQPWQLNAEFSFITETRMPASSFSTFVTAPSGPLAGAAVIDLAPMRKVGVASDHNVTLTRVAGGAPAADAAHWVIGPAIGLFPEATWRWTDPQHIQAAARTLPALSGLTVQGVALPRGQSALIPISSMIDDLPERAKPLPFATLTVSIVNQLKGYGVSAEALATGAASAPTPKLLNAAAQMLSGGGLFARMRTQAGVPAAGLSAMARRSLTRYRSAPPLIAPLTTGLTMNKVGLAAPPAIFRAPEAGPVVLEAPRLRAVLQGRPQPTVDAPAAAHTTVLKVAAAANAPRLRPPALDTLAGARLESVAAPKAPRPTQAALGSRTLHNPETGMLAGGAHADAFRKAADQLRGDGIVVPAGATHVWDLPAGSPAAFRISGDSGARCVCLDRAGNPLSDIELLAGPEAPLAFPAPTATVIFQCLGKLPGKLSPAMGFGAVSSAAAPAGGLAATGWQSGNHGQQAGPATVLGRGSTVLLPRPSKAIRRGQGTSYAMTSFAQAVADQTGVETWLPRSASVVMILLDGQDPTAAADGDLALAVQGASLRTPPIPVGGGRRRALLYDVVNYTGPADHFSVSAASRQGWQISGVAGLGGSAREWAERMHGDVPERVVADGPLSPDGSLRVRFVTAPPAAGEQPR